VDELPEERAGEELSHSPHEQLVGKAVHVSRNGPKPHYVGVARLNPQ
jgi:hypothetical protein